MFTAADLGRSSFGPKGCGRLETKGPRVSCSKAVAAIIDVQAVETAARLLGVINPVKVRTTKGTRRIGCHRFDTEDNCHAITFSTRRRTTQQQSETIWHELCHAAQGDQIGNEDYIAQYKLAGGTGRRYDTNKFEVQANAVKDWHTFLPLVKGSYD